MVSIVRAACPRGTLTRRHPNDCLAQRRGFPLVVLAAHVPWPCSLHASCSPRRPHLDIACPTFVHVDNPPPLLDLPEFQKQQPAKRSTILPISPPPYHLLPEGFARPLIGGRSGVRSAVYLQLVVLGLRRSGCSVHSRALLASSRLVSSRPRWRGWSAKHARCRSVWARQGAPGIIIRGAARLSAAVCRDSSSSGRL